MSLFCAISGQPPLDPVLSIKSGTVYERQLITKYLRDNAGKDPITGDQLNDEDLVAIKTAPSAPSAPPRAPTFTSVPSLLHTLQSEWDACMLECHQLRRQGDELRQELSHALYKEDAAMRVLARLARERDEARSALASIKAQLGPAFSSAEGDAQGSAPTAGGDDVEMEADAAGLPAEAKKRVHDTTQALSSTRKKRKAPEGYASQDSVKAFTQSATVPSLHGTKPPGISALEAVNGGSSFVTGGLDKAVQLYDRSTDKIVATLKGHTKKVTAVAASTAITSDDLAIPTFLVSSSLDKSVRIWTPSGKKAVYEVAANLSTSGEVAGISVHPSQTLVASCSSDGSWAIHELLHDGLSGKPSTLLTGSLPADAADGTSNTAIAFHPDGAIFAVGSSDSQIRVFDTVTGSCAATFEGHTSSGAGAIASLSFSENGYTLASAAAGSSEVKLWDLRKLTNSANIALEDGIAVNAIKFDPYAQFLAVVGTDARVYANKTWALLVKNEDNAAELTGVSWGSNSDELLVAGLDRSVRVLAASKE